MFEEIREKLVRISQAHPDIHVGLSAVVDIVAFNGDMPEEDYLAIGNSSTVIVGQLVDKATAERGIKPFWRSEKMVEPTQKLSNQTSRQLVGAAVNMVREMMETGSPRIALFDTTDHHAMALVPDHGKLAFLDTSPATLAYLKPEEAVGRIVGTWRKGYILAVQDREQKNLN